MSSSHSLGIMKRDIADFTGNIFVIAGMIDDYNRYKHNFEINEPSKLIYQTNVRDDASVDYIVDCRLAHAFDKIGSRKFDIVYFANMSTISADGRDMLTAIKNACHLLSPNGVLIYRGGFVNFPTSNVLNFPMILTDLGLHNIAINYFYSDLAGVKVIGFKNPKMQLDQSMLAIPNLNIVLAETIMRGVGSEDVKDLIKNPELLLKRIQEILKPCDPRTHIMPPITCAELLGRIVELDDESLEDKRIKLTRKLLEETIQWRRGNNIISIPEILEFIDTSLRTNGEGSATYFSDDFLKSESPVARIFKDLFIRNSAAQLTKQFEKSSSSGAPLKMFTSAESSQPASSPTSIHPKPPSQSKP